jgi:hypothetical protein
MPNVGWGSTKPFWKNKSNYITKKEQPSTLKKIFCSPNSSQKSCIAIKSVSLI